jgi:phenylalanyl-tRNA synthetase beta chain
VAGARISSPITDIDHTAKHRSEVHLKFADLERLAGLHIPADQVVRILELLDFRIRERNAQGLHVQVPAYRVDVHRPADVVEEVLRIHGYDHVPLPKHVQLPPVLHEALTLETLRMQVGQHLAARGLREVMTPSLVSGERVVKGGTHTAGQLITLANPLSAELDVLRPTLLPGLLQALAYNLNRQQRDLRFFERGRTYTKEGERMVERETLGLVITGRRERESWRSTTEKVDLFDLKEELEVLMERLGLTSLVHWEPLGHALLEQACTVLVKGREVGAIGAVRKSALKAADVNQPVLFAELDEQALLDACRAQAVGFTEVPRFPSVRRDLSLLLEQGVRFEQLRKLAFNAERKLLREVDLFDVYQGDKLPAGKKSYALSFILQDAEKTLTDDQVDKAMGRIRQTFEKEVGAELRG